ncbi:MAG: SurA N-terminal domain-containing protein [Patescibacteria group bacterium]
MEHQQHGEVGKHATGGRSDLLTIRLTKKTAWIFAVVVLLLVLGYVFKGLFIAATVDGTLITRFAMIRELENVSGKQALDSLIVQKLVYAEARKKGVTVGDSEIDLELSKIENQVKTQGGTLEQVLAGQGLTLDVLKEQIRTQKTLEKLIPGKVEVTDLEVGQYIKDNQISVPAGQEEKYNALVKDQLSQQKQTAARQAFVNDLRARATIRTFVSY